MARFKTLLDKYRKYAFSERDKGDKFERLMAAYLQTDPKYANEFKKVWLWFEFPGRKDLGGNDTGIDIVALTNDNKYWAIQCKCYAEGTTIDKKAVDGFLSTSSRQFKDENLKTVRFSHRLWIDTTGKRWSSNAENVILNQNIPVTRIGLFHLEEAPVQWDKLDEGISGVSARTQKYEVKKHQKTALDSTHDYFKEKDRGKLIMACGTGKTFTALRIAEHETNHQGLILFLVPSIALIGQTLNEWTAQAIKPINPICICSQPDITKKKQKGEDADFYSVIDLALPASTDTEVIKNQFKYHKEHNKGGMTVVFSTYQSIEVIARAQKAIQKEEGDAAIFDLIICDEAHRTTGVTLSDEDESAFTKVHSNEFIVGKKRLYMTATPRLYDPKVKDKAAQDDILLCSMDDETIYGEEIYRIGFGEAVERNLLTDYKVLILTLSDKDVPPSVQKMISDEEQEINADDASKLIGCINALAKQMLGDDGALRDIDPGPMKRAVAFCSRINPTAYSDATASTTIANYFNTVSENYIDSLPEKEQYTRIATEAKHIDGTMAAPEREELLNWLKEDSDHCRILTNVRCLSEGVDVPSLDAVMFLSARNSEVDVVQSVGRVMRRAEGKKYGYIIIPVLVPSDIEADKALDDNKRYAVVWTVLNALRAHDDRFNAIINKIDLNKKRPDQILIGRPDYSFDEDGNWVNENEDGYKTNKLNQQFALQFEALQNVLYARLVKKVGDRRYWEQWAQNVGEIATRLIERFTYLTEEKTEHREAFELFLKGLQANINSSITKKEAIEMLAQHMITKPVFEALFEGYSFVDNNAISQSMQKMVGLLEEGALEKDTKVLNKFYESVRMRAAGIDNAEGKQRIIIELYDKFFKTAFPRMVEQLGIVYTPVEVVDFILHSVNDVLQQEFGQSISDENVHVLDPFTGTGTFITRLIQSGLIKKEDLPRKYDRELHANEIVLLAYYIADVNIENAYHDVMGNEGDYVPFDGIVLTDTFQLGETKDSVIFSEMFPQNSERLEIQKKGPIRVIVGNPPYSIGQKDANDNAQNQSYELLDARIANTYAKESKAGLNKSLYDAYIKAFRWSTDRLADDEGGIIGFVTNGTWLDGNSQDGFRKVLEKEFDSIYVFNLRGNARTSGELRRKEAGNVFKEGSRTPISITILVKNPEKRQDKAVIKYHDIGDYLSREDKLKIISEFGYISNPEMKLKTLKPNEHGDWINQRNEAFDEWIPIETEKKIKNVQSYFTINGPGISSGRDFWVYNFSKNKLHKNLDDSLRFYNEQRIGFKEAQKINDELKVNDYISSDSTKISWTVNLKNSLEKNKNLNLYKDKFFTGIYRPFFSQNLYYDDSLIERPGLNRVFFPERKENLVITISGIGSSKSFSTLITNKLISYDFLEKTQCFPLHYYEEQTKQTPGLFDQEGESEYIRHDGVSDFILGRAQKQYGKSVTKEDIFYYVYGILHSPDYRETFANDLKKMLPRIPLVDSPNDFWKFSKSGRALADLHINYESVPAYPEVEIQGQEALINLDAYAHYAVSKMKFPKKDQKDTIIYNGRIKIKNIPEKAYDYVVNGKSAIEWIMERYQVTTDKKSGITNNPNDWSKEHDNPSYIFDLLLSIINVSVQTVDIVAGLPRLEFE
ncbi:DEAD/DEAH box helicase family protein [Subsaxibacter sp. CAU 1640]|uniref:DEAD/DEAH box helicase n=1 Tax=Subsaxibacter sp. CAU 1640 TaxID=2933271 RepID=UPI002006671A|nr:type ISP restriction/modification enzyme [Subsaxibacter sp. CAU 1640]MCK7590609.1 DEAD/DEAH box helicase family protein [Subsaxibacter sp. CAU 1640]